MSQWMWGRLIWYGGFVGTVFMVLEMLGLTGVAPWPTFSGTVEHDVRTYPWFAALALTVCLGVSIHWLFGQKFFPSIFCAGCIALNLHLLNNKWP